MTSTFADIERSLRQPPPMSEAPTLAPLNLDERSGNELRPATFDEMVGQTRLKSLLQRVVSVAKTTGKPLDHMLLVGSAGTGKTTFALVIAHELGTRVFMLKAPVAFNMFEALAQAARPGDVCVIDEIHLQCSGDRRGLTQAADPEVFYHVLEDKRLMAESTMIPFPDVTFIGCTTDAGLLPEPFLDRFPLQPQLDEYTDEEMAVLAKANARWLDMQIDDSAALVFARASRDVPRQINTYVRNARSLNVGSIDEWVAKEIVCSLNSTTLDGLTRDMQLMLKFLLACRREDAKGNVRYQSGVNSIATALGKSRDSKAVALYVEPYLIKAGYVIVTHGGRALTDRGRERAEQL